MTNLKQIWITLEETVDAKTFELIEMLVQESINETIQLKEESVLFVE